VPYTIEIADHDHPVTRGVPDIEIASEQYYLHVDPTVHVLARSTFTGEHWPWLDRVQMPAAYVHRWGQGRIFYASPGHVPAELQIPAVQQLVAQGLAWAARS
jgi:type 1 glutamine amidotransferase